MTNNLTYYQEQSLKAILRHSKHNPITGLAITKKIHIKERDSGKEGADIRAIINALRSKGYPICATGQGYYYARTGPELSEFISSFQARIDKQRKALDGLNAGFDKFNLNFDDPTEIDIAGSGEDEIIKTQSWRIESNKTHGLFYIVTDVGSHYNCNCSGFKYYRKCRHIEEVKKLVKAKTAKEIKEKQKSLL